MPSHSPPLQGHAALFVRAVGVLDALRPSVFEADFASLAKQLRQQQERPFFGLF